MRLRGAAAAAITFLGILAAVTAWFTAMQSVESPQHNTTSNGESQLSSLPEHPQYVPSPVAVGPASSTPLGVMDLAYHCPSLRHGKLAEGCLEVLDQRFLGREPYSGLHDGLVQAPIIRLDTRMTWNRVFLALREKRSRVAKTLSDPMCRPDEGVHPERSEHCGASDMAELATLKLECGGHAFTTRLDALNWEVNERVAALRIDEVDDTSSYWEYRNIVEDAHYRDAWLMARCLEVPTDAWRRTGAFESLFPFEYRGPPWANVANPHDVVSSRDRSQDRRWLEHNISQETEGYRLMLTAARLGNEWALAQVAGMVEEFADEMDVAHPVLGQIMRVKHYAGYVGSMDDATKRAYRLRHAANAVRLAEDHGIELDMPRLSALVEGRTSLYTPPPRPQGRAAVDDESVEWVVDAVRKDGPE